MRAILDKISWKLGFHGPIPSPPDRSGLQGPFVALYDYPRHQPATVQLDDHDFEIADGPSFYWMHKEIYLDEVYHFRREREAPFIIDCGANYGVSVAWFKHFCPDARIVAVEADPSIFQLLSRNINRRNFSDVNLLHRAVSDTAGTVAFQCIGADAGRISSDNSQVATGGESIINVETIQLDDLIGEETVDFLKVDIEGAELDVLASSKKLSQVKQLFIEYHSFINAPQRLSTLLGILEKEGFRYYINQICSPRNPYLEITHNQSMDLQLSVFATRA